jgi:Uma2 family endonuclease
VLAPTDVVVPDLFVVLTPRRAILTPQCVAGTPDLVVEILSPSTRAIDLTKKKVAYERARVPEYWVVDPDRHVVDQHLLGGDAYASPTRCAEVIEYRGLAGVRVDLREVW